MSGSMELGLFVCLTMFCEQHRFTLTTNGPENRSIVAYFICIQLDNLAGRKTIWIIGTGIKGKARRSLLITDLQCLHQDRTVLRCHQIVFMMMRRNKRLVFEWWFFFVQVTISQATVHLLNECWYP